MEIIDAPPGFVYSTDSPVGPTFDEMMAEPVQIPDAGAAPSSSLVSSDYWRGKIAEFQSTMNAADRAYQAVQAVMFTEGAIQSPEVWDSLMQSLAEYDARKYLMRTTAEAINLGVQAINSLGGNLQSLRLPGSLGFAPAVPVVAIAALGTAAVLTAWGREWIGGVNSRLKLAQAMDAQLSPDARARLAAAVVTTEAAQKEADGSLLGSLAPLAKWGAIALAAWAAWRAFERYSQR